MLPTTTLSPFEKGEVAFLKQVKKWRRDQNKSWVDYVSALSHLEIRCCHAHDLNPPTTAPHHAPAWFIEQCASLDTTWLRERHFLGWFHQHYHEIERKRSFRQTETTQGKHTDPIASTQLYTPAWLADAMVVLATQQRTQNTLPTVFDPACGGGQLLLAALEHLCQQHPNTDGLTLLSTIHGCDLDPHAVDAARRGLLLLIRCHRPQAPVDKLRERLEQQLVVADGLIHAPQVAPTIVLSNPPYMGARTMPEDLKQTLQTHWTPFHSDLYISFMARCLSFDGAIVAILAQQTVWYLKRFERARTALLASASLCKMIHIGAHAFRTLQGEKANVAITIHAPKTDSPISFLDLRAPGTVAEKRQAFMRVLDDPSQYTTRPQEDFHTIPGRPLAYWLPNTVIRQFDTGVAFGEVATIPGSQNKTGLNKNYVRAWLEVDAQDIHPTEDLWPSQLDSNDARRWRFYSKGGRFAPWWGNWHHVVDWSEAARTFYRENQSSNLLDTRFWDREGLCYTDFGGNSFNARWMPRGCVFDMAGPAIFSNQSGQMARRDLLSWLAVLNSTAARLILNALNPSIHYQVRDLRNLPLPNWSYTQQTDIAAQAEQILQQMKSLHTTLTDDPLARHVDAASTPDHEDARAIYHDTMARWRGLNEIVCDLYEISHGTIETPQHHAFKHLR